VLVRGTLHLALVFGSKVVAMRRNFYPTLCPTQLIPADLNRSCLAEDGHFSRCLS
jgi:hypothetical protein